MARPDHLVESVSAILDSQLRFVSDDDQIWKIPDSDCRVKAGDRVVLGLSRFDIQYSGASAQRPLGHACLFPAIGNLADLVEILAEKTYRRRNSDENLSFFILVVDI